MVPATDFNHQTAIIVLVFNTDIHRTATMQIIAKAVLIGHIAKTTVIIHQVRQRTVVVAGMAGAVLLICRVETDIAKATVIICQLRKKTIVVTGIARAVLIHHMRTGIVATVIVLCWVKKRAAETTGINRTVLVDRIRTGIVATMIVLCQVQ